jgi:hypothetical protein
VCIAVIKVDIDVDVVECRLDSGPGRWKAGVYVFSEAGV